MYDFVQGRPRPQYGPYGLSGKFRILNLEMTNRCGYNCFCCPRERMTRPHGILTEEKLKILLSRIDDFVGTVNLHGYGEPLLDKDLPKKIALIKKHWPKSQPTVVTTLGYSFDDSFLKDLFDCGLSHISVSCYGYNIQSYNEIHNKNTFDAVINNIVAISELRRTRNFTFHVNLEGFVHKTHVGHKAFANHSREKDVFVSMLEHSGITYSCAEIHDFGSEYSFSGRQYRPLPCSVVWGDRAEILQVSWNLNVIPCCMFFNDDIVLGNLEHNSIEEIYNSEAYRDFYLAHWEGRVGSLLVCNNCTYKFDMLRHDDIARIIRWYYPETAYGSYAGDGSPHPGSLAKGIKIVSATYGGNIDSNILTYPGPIALCPDNVKDTLSLLCDGKPSCDLLIDVATFGDPASGHAKALSVCYTYLDDPQGELHHIYVDEEAHGKYLRIPEYAAVDL